MRRMTKVSPYPYWHFFDAYPPGYLRAVYRGNGIPLPWGNLAQVSDPCPQLGGVPHDRRASAARSGSQISVLRDGDRSLLYCCHSDARAGHGGQPARALGGLDLAPALDANGVASRDIIDSVFARMPAPPRRRRAFRRLRLQALVAVANVLNIAWIEDALEQPARIICPRSSRCPRPERCEGAKARPSRAREIDDVRDEILGREPVEES